MGDNINWDHAMKELCKYGEADRTFDNRIYYYVQSYMRAKHMGLPTIGIGFTDSALYGPFEVIGFIMQDERLLRDNTDLNGNVLPTKEILSFIEELPYTVQGKPGIISFYQE
jgi:hypothetical protein